MKPNDDMLEHLGIRYVEEPESHGLEFFEAIQKTFVLVNHDNFTQHGLKEKVYSRLRFNDIEMCEVHCDVLNQIGVLLDNVRIIVIERESETIIGGGCHVKKCKHHIVLLKRNNLYFHMDIDRKKCEKIEKILDKGIYKFSKKRRRVKFLFGLCVLFGGVYASYHHEKAIKTTYENFAVPSYGDIAIPALVNVSSLFSVQKSYPMNIYNSIMYMFSFGTG